jgi:hypothetical protein
MKKGVEAMQLRSGHPRTVLLCSLIALALLFCTASFATAQFNEGQVVQAEDGSLYVFEGGQLHRIEPVTATMDQIAGASMGDPVQLGVTIIQPPPAVSTGPAVAAPSGLRMSVLNVERPHRGSSAAPSGREWALIRVRIENGTDQSWSTGAFFGPARVFAIDARGASVAAERQSVPEAIAPNTRVGPGLAIEGALVFAVATGVPIQRVIWQEGSGTLMEAAVP